MRGRIPNYKRKEEIEKLKRAGFSYNEIASMLQLKSRQLVHYHLRSLRKKTK
jgi:DNA-binding CsgD family transcriptional regulator